MKDAQRLHTLASVMAVALALPLPADGASAAGSIFLLSGMPLNLSAGLSSTLFEFDLGSGRLLSQKPLDPGGDSAIDFITPDYDRRVIILARPMYYPREFSVIHMDAPGTISELSGAVTYRSEDKSVTEAFTIGAPGEQATVAVRAGTRLLGLPIDHGAKATAVPEGGAAYIRTDGVFGVTEIRNASHIIRLGSDHLSIWDGAKAVTLGLPSPKLATARADRELACSLEVRNDASTVVSVKGEQEFSAKGLGRLGSSVHYVYAAKNTTWRALTVPGSDSTVRAFGSWLAFVIAGAQPWSIPDPSKRGSTVVVDPARHTESPGRAERAGRSLLTVEDVDKFGMFGPKLTAQYLFEDDVSWYPGRLMLYNVDTGKTYWLNTEQGDSEVLLVEGSDVYYRVNLALFRGKIGATTVENTTRVLAHPSLGTVHYAFIPH